MSSTAYFNQLWFSVSFDLSSCPSTVVGAEITADIDGSTYFGPQLPLLALGGRGYGADFDSVVLNLHTTSHIATVVFAHRV